MATTLDERRQKTNQRPAAAMDLASVDGAAPLNLTRPGTMKPDAPAPIPTQPAPQFTRTNAGPMLQQPATPAPAPASPSPASQQLANQTAMYVQGAQAAAAQRPANSAQQMVDAPMSTPVRNSISAAVANPQPALGTAIDTSPRLFDPATGRPSAGAQAANDQLARVKAMAQPGLPGISAANAATVQSPAVTPTPQPQGEYSRQMSGVGQFFGDAIKTLVSAPGYGMNKGNPTAAPAAQVMTDYGNEGRRAPMPAVPAVPAAAVAAAQGQRGTLEAQAKNPASDQGQVPGAAPPMPQGAELAGPPSGYTNTSVDGVYRKGNSFMDEAGTRAAPRAGTVSAQNNAAAEALASGMGANQQALARMQAANAPAAPAAQQLVMPTVKTSANDWQTRNDLRSLRVSANSLSNEPRWGGQGAKSPDVIAYEQALATDNALKQGKNPLAQELLQQQGGIARTTIQDQGETTRANTREQGANARAAMTEGIQRGELGIKQEAQGFASRAAQRLEAAQAAYDNAKTDEERAAAAKRIRAMQGKGEDVAAKDRYLVTGGETRVVDGQTVKDPQRIFDTQTRQFVDASQGAQDIASDPRAMAIRNNAALTREQKAAELKKLGYS